MCRNYLDSLDYRRRDILARSRRQNFARALPAFKCAAAMRKRVMSEKGGSQNRRGAVKLSELVGKALDPVIARRGFATADLIAAWADIVGPRHAAWTAPEKITWPRDAKDGAGAGTLVLRVDGPRAILIQHELGQIVERVNAFFGYAAIARARIVQAPVTGAASQPAATTEPVLDKAGETALGEAIAGVESDALKAALDRLGRGILAKDFKNS
jgi:hypothetical protein